MKIPGQTLLKVTGILMIIGAVLTVIISLLGVIGGAAVTVTSMSGVADDAEVAAAATGLGVAIIVLFVIALITGVFELIAGIFGVKKSGVPNSAKPCFIIGIVIIALNVISTIIGLVNGGGFSIVSFATGLVVPVLYTIGAYQNMNAQG